MKKTSVKLRGNGFSLVDTMVGMVIAMIGMVIIFQVFSVSEGVKRTTTSGSDAQQTGSISLVTIERALKDAGYGIFVSNTPPIPNDAAATSTPITIAFGAANASDTITVVSRRNWDYGPFFDPANIAGVLPPPLTTETITVDNLNVPATRNNIKGQLQLISFTTMAPNAAPPYVFAGPIVPAATFVIADGIALMKAQYGIDGANGNAIDGIIQPGEWTTVPPVNPWLVLAVRLVIVARSAQPEKPNPATGLCDATVAPPVWSGTASIAGSTATPLLLSGQADLVAAGDAWQCYRYKTFETTVPMRNIMWRLTV
jgi:type IV pilus assembly protein PilW